MSLLENLSYKESQAALSLTSDECDSVASLANLRDVKYKGQPKPGQKLLNDLNRRGFSANQYRQYIKTVLRSQRKYHYRPKTKIAILIGNNNYKNLSNLATPSTDCDMLANSLRSLGFIAITIKNVKTDILKRVLDKIFNCIPNDSYCFVFYAGHGFELCNIKYLLCTDSPNANLVSEECICENYVLSCVAKCKPELCVFIMDMCRLPLNRESNPKLYSVVPTLPEYKIDNNLYIVHTTQSEMSAYEMVQIECSQTVDNMSYVLKTGDSKFVVLGTSQYVAALCTHLEDDFEVSLMLDKVHEDLENAPRKQIPIKLQSGVAKRSLHDLPSGNITSLLKKLKEIISCDEFKDYCVCY